MENEAIDSDLLVSSNTDFLYKTLFISKRAQSSKEPTVTITALTNIIGCGIVDKELWVVKNVCDSLDGSGREIEPLIVIR